MPTWWSEPDSHHAFVLSWISVLITVAAAVTGLVIFTSTGSALILCYGLENCVDFLSSVVVLWRFYCPHALTAEVEEKLRHREKRASIAISFILFLLGFGITVTAIHDFVHGAETPEELRIVLGISFVSILIFGLLTIVKFHYSILLESASLQKDGICSLIGTVLSGALFVNTLIIDHYPSAWWIDPAVALGCGIASIIIGLYAVCVAGCVQKLPICSPRWWFLSQGDGKDEITGRPLEPQDFIPGETEMTEKVKPETSGII
jgi:divalent metal cation (Fe/Co/Zn/Cd) transporter